MWFVVFTLVGDLMVGRVPSCFEMLQVIWR
jgi:hypothetical protein